MGDYEKHEQVRQDLVNLAHKAFIAVLVVIISFSVRSDVCKGGAVYRLARHADGVPPIHGNASQRNGDKTRRNAQQKRPTYRRVRQCRGKPQALEVWIKPHQAQLWNASQRPR